MSTPIAPQPVRPSMFLLTGSASFEALDDDPSFMTVALHCGDAGSDSAGIPAQGGFRVAHNGFITKEKQSIGRTILDGPEPTIPAVVRGVKYRGPRARSWGVRVLRSVALLQSIAPRPGAATESLRRIIYIM